MSTDQAHSLGDVLGVPVPPTGQRDPVRILADLDAGAAGAGAGSLDALALDTLALLEVRWRAVAGPLAATFTESDLGDVAPEELSSFPGIQEVLGLHEVAELAGCGSWDHVVVDCASTADALRMLTLPATFALYVERAWPRHRRLSIAPGDGQLSAVADLLERTAGRVDALSALISDADSVGAHLVLTPERVVAAEAVRTLGSLALMGVQVNELIVNQVLLQDDSYEYRNLPEHPAFDWYAERIAEQQSVLESVYRMRLDLPLDGGSLGSLTLGRVGDDLVIGVGGMRRRVRLASVLRRCRVTGATLSGNDLTVRFQPDPEVWPK